MKFKEELSKRLKQERPSFGTELFYIDGLHIIAEYYRRFDGTYNIVYTEK
jgi:hypothetical protein